MCERSDYPKISPEYAAKFMLSDKEYQRLVDKAREEFKIEFERRRPSRRDRESNMCFKNRYPYLSTERSTTAVFNNCAFINCTFNF